MIFVWYESTGIAQFPNRVCVSHVDPRSNDLDKLDREAVYFPLLKYQTPESVALPLANVLRAGAPNDVTYLGNAI